MIKVVISIFTVILIYFSAKIAKDNKGVMQLSTPEQVTPVVISPDIKIIVPPEVKTEQQEQANRYLFTRVKSCCKN